MKFVCVFNFVVEFDIGFFVGYVCCYCDLVVLISIGNDFCFFGEVCGIEYFVGEFVVSEKFVERL